MTKTLKKLNIYVNNNNVKHSKLPIIRISDGSMYHNLIYAYIITFLDNLIYDYKDPYQFTKNKY